MARKREVRLAIESDTDRPNRMVIRRSRSMTRAEIKVLTDSGRKFDSNNLCILDLITIDFCDKPLSEGGSPKFSMHRSICTE